MAEPLTHLQQRLATNWLIGLEAQKLADLATERVYQLHQLKQANLQPIVLLAEPDLLVFLASFVAACSADCPVFLGNPQWTETEWQQVFDRVTPDVIWRSDRASLLTPLHTGHPNSFKVSLPKGDLGGSLSFPSNWIMIPTGGSSGQIRFAIHTWETLTASVEGFRAYFQVDRVHSCCVLPLYHVSGLMQFMRSFLSGGKLAVLSSKALETGVDEFDPAEFFLSLVPTQLQRLLQTPGSIDWLARFHTVLLGGAPAWDELLETARNHRIRLAPTYGMTETASQIVTLKPEDFLRGQTGCGQVLPHAEVMIRNLDNPTVQSDLIGTIAIKAASLALGYYPESFNPSGIFTTDDLGFFDAEGYLHIVGRNSHKIITGGENVFPAEVEAAIRSTGLIRDVCVLGIPDREWGEVVTAVYIPANAKISVSELRLSLVDRLSKFKCPKHWIVMEQLPRNAQGKINYTQLKQLLISDCD
ncbi:MAG: 2-succinylbenzoate--CoA ligase [Cyanobacteria bacterium CRU_2_1]|nr:2-succinylbenzoate--CoA ligase [Cyanobacteria bacterium RU_5_0]NJR61782.1 2-succinylbenzoate--CoA ligase [Cyanobacteria bacterium CRU_2_1]